MVGGRRWRCECVRTTKRGGNYPARRAPTKRTPQSPSLSLRAHFDPTTNPGKQGESMENPLDIKLSGNNISEFLQSYRVALRQLAVPDKQLLWRSFEVYFGLGGAAMVFEKMNNRKI